MEDVTMVDRRILRSVISTLKTLEVRGGYDAYDRLVGCVMLLEQIVNTPTETEETQENG